MKKMGKGHVGVTGTGGSAKQGTSTGSGSRPGKSKFAIPTSGPADMHGLGRATSGYLQ